MEKIVRKLVYGIAIVGTLYHLYLVLHPYTPFAHLHISVLDLTQVQRATHVFLICSNRLFGEFRANKGQKHRWRPCACPAHGLGPV